MMNSTVLLDLVPKLVKEKDNINLTKRITLEELKEAVDDMEYDKAPGLDGFNSNFIKICWEIIHKDLLKMVVKPQQSEKIGGSTNSTFLALIPKEKMQSPLIDSSPSLYVTLVTKLLQKPWLRG